MTIFTPISSSPFKMVIGHPFVAPAYTNLITRLGSHGTFTRGSTATMWSNGKLVSAGVNIARFDTDPITRELKGLLIEEARTNLVRNADMYDTVDGVVGSGGVLPSTWSTASRGLTVTLTSGVENGMKYLDIQMAGTTTSAGEVYINASRCATSASGDYALTYKTAHIAGTFTNTGTPTTQVNFFDTSSGYISSTSQAISGLTSTLSDNLMIHTTPALTASSDPLVYKGYVSSGVVVDFTIRIALTQLEQGSFPTSYIPTAGATATRAADIATVPVSTFDFNPLQGTIYTDFQRYEASTNTGKVFQIDSGAFSNSIRGFVDAGSRSLFGTKVTDGGVDQEVMQQTLGGINLRGITALAYKINDFGLSVNGATASTDTSGTIPVGLTHVRIGSGVSSSKLNGHIKELRYYPTRLANGQLESMTT